MGPKTRLLTHQERIILLLKEVEYDEDDYVAPYLLCQDGISDALNILKNNVSREISDLKEECLVEEKLSRVKGMDRRRNIYLLTEKGENAAEKILESLKEEEILIKLKNKEKVKIGKAVQILEKDHPNVTPFYVEEWMRKKDVLDVDEFKTPSYADKKTEEEKVEMVISAPLKGEFYGRKEEIDKIRSLLEKQKSPIILITGIAGIGKSSLGTMIIDEFKQKRDILWYNFHHWDNKESFGKVLSDFCVRGGSNSIDTEKTLPVITTEFVDKISELNPLIFLDECENASDELDIFFEIMLEHRKRGEQFSLILMNREKMSFYDVRDVMDDYVFELELGPLDIESVREMIGAEEDVEDIYEKTEGHPLYVELSRKYPGETTQINDFIENEIYSELNKDEREILRKLSVFWEPVKKEIILDKEDSDVLIGLKNNNLVKETREGKVTIHSILKDFFYSHLSMEERNDLHLKAAKRLESIESDRNLEILHHYEKSGKWKESLEMLNKLSHSIGSLSESIRDEIIKSYPLDKIPENEKSNYFEVLGDIFLESEEWEKAQNYYQKTVENGLDSTLIREKMGEAQMKLERWKETIDSHEKALRKYKEKDYKEGIIREYLSLGTVYRNKGDYEKAESYYRKVQKMISKKNFKDIKPNLYNNMGMLELGKKNFQKAEMFMNKSLKLGGEKGVVYENLSLLYKNKGEIKKSLNLLEKSIKNYLERGSQNSAVNLLFDSADRYQELGMVDKA
ncbi:MAG: tetratricopeptide repeat protein, partial [Thermoplasmata archaeon]